MIKNKQTNGFKFSTLTFFPLSIDWCLLWSINGLIWNDVNHLISDNPKMIYISHTKTLFTALKAPLQYHISTLNYNFTIYTTILPCSTLYGTEKKRKYHSVIVMEMKINHFIYMLLIVWWKLFADIENLLWSPWLGYCVYQR